MTSNNQLGSYSKFEKNILPPIQDGSVLLLELPQFSVDVKRSSKVSLPLLVTVLGHVTQAIEQLLGLLQEVAELAHNLPLLLVHGVRGRLT